VRVLLKLLLLNGLAACGAPGSDAVFDVRKTKSPVVDTTKAKAPVPQPAPRLATRRYSGYFRRVADTVQFQPCGMNVFDVVISPQGTASLELRERYRFTAPWPGAKMFSVFRGAMITDSVSRGDDSVRSIPRTRFLLTGVDSMRATRSSDCGGMSPS
jgi:hypothetical protein